MDRIATLRGPRDLDGLTEEDLAELSEQIREFLVEKVSRTGGHLGPNLGVVELTLAIHRVFDSPHDAIIWDTGHQAYVHKIVTGRAAGFDALRKRRGLSGYPDRGESPHDWVENSHASTALSYADGLAKAWKCTGEPGSRRVVAVVGDGSLTGGMAWEALNNIAAGDRQVIIVVNDNGRSYSPTIGGVADHLATLRTTSGYENFLRGVRRGLSNTPVVGPPVYEALHGIKTGIKDMVAPQGLFQDLGLKYIGPVDGHDIASLEHALSRASSFAGPVIVHAITEKGHGYAPAETDEADRFHGIGAIDPGTGRPLKSAGSSWTSVFADELVKLGTEDPRIVGITAAMAGPTGIGQFAERFPDRAYDVGIAEQHAVTSAVGMAMGGLRPVVAVYATFLNRAFDQVLMDAALHRQPVTIVLDRAGITGDDGPSHNGMWDMSMLQVVPGLRLAAPRDEDTLRQALRLATSADDGPSVVRFPKGALGRPVPAVSRVSGVDVLREAVEPDVVMIAVGATSGPTLEAADRLADQGFTVRVLAPTWVLPVPEGLDSLVSDAALVATVEDGARVGGVGSRISLELADRGIDVPVRCFGIPSQFLEVGSRAEVVAALQLTGSDIGHSLVSELSATGAAVTQLLERRRSADRPGPGSALS